MFSVQVDLVLYMIKKLKCRHKSVPSEEQSLCKQILKWSSTDLCVALLVFGRMGGSLKPWSSLSNLREIRHKVLTASSKGNFFYNPCSCSVMCPTLCDPKNCRTPGFPVLHCLPEFAQTHVHWINDAIQLSHSLFTPSALNLSQHQGLFQWIGSSHQVSKVLELQHQSFQWIFRVDFL